MIGFAQTGTSGTLCLPESGHICMVILPLWLLQSGHICDNANNLAVRKLLQLWQFHFFLHSIIDNRNYFQTSKGHVTGL